MRHGLPVEDHIESDLIDLAYKHDLPLVATNDVFFAEENMFEAHEVLLCIAQNATLSRRDRWRVTPDHRFKSAAEMRALFSDVPEAVDRSEEHTSELQSLMRISYAVFCLKKKNINTTQSQTH